MGNLQQSRNLAYEIGLCRIALVVEQLHSRTKNHPELARIFRVSENDGDRRARLTYFWWVVLGGNRLRDTDLQMIPQIVVADVTLELLHGWLGIFRQAALPIIGEEFTRAWGEKAERLARKFLITDEDDADKLAKAS